MAPKIPTEADLHRGNEILQHLLRTGYGTRSRRYRRAYARLESQRRRCLAAFQKAAAAAAVAQSK